MISRRVAFRADASHALGFGHVARLCALVEEVASRGHEPIAMFGGDAGSIAAWARDRRIVVEHAAWTPLAVAAAVEARRIDAVFIDGPAVAATLVPVLAERAIPTHLIDDAGSLLGVDAVVNHNIHASMLAPHYPRAGRCLLGRRYLMLRRDIRRFPRGACRPLGGKRLRVLITFGGSDPPNATARLVRLLPGDRPLEVVVVLGPGYRDDGRLAIAVDEAARAGHTLDIRRSPDDPGALFVGADAAICSAGGTLGELAYLGCPALAYAIVADQVAPARRQVRDGLISGGRRLEEADDDMVRNDLLRFLVDDTGRIYQRARALATADADGARRIVDELL